MGFRSTSSRSNRIIRPGAESASREQVRAGPRQHRLGVSTATCRQMQIRRYKDKCTCMSASAQSAAHCLPAHSQQPGESLPIGFVPLWVLPVSADPARGGVLRPGEGGGQHLPEVKNRMGRRNKLNDSPGVQLFASAQSKELRKTRPGPKSLGCRCGFQENRKTVACGRAQEAGQFCRDARSSPTISLNPPNGHVWQVFAGEETETGLGKVTCSQACRCDRQTWDPDAGLPSRLPIPQPGSPHLPRQLCLSPLALGACLWGLRFQAADAHLPQTWPPGAPTCADRGCGNGEFSRKSRKCIFQDRLAGTSQLQVLVQCPSQNEQRSLEESK